MSSMRFGSLALPVALLAALLTSCSSSSNSTQNKASGPPPPAHFMATNTDNTAAKYIELVGLRITERSPGHLTVRFGLVNHSDADVGELKMNVNLTTTVAKPGDPPLFSFPAEVADLGPNELKDVSVEVPTKMRVYELPDWQFLKANFVITEPAQ